MFISSIPSALSVQMIKVVHFLFKFGPSYLVGLYL